MPLKEISAAHDSQKLKSKSNCIWRNVQGSGINLKKLSKARTPLQTLRSLKSLKRSFNKEML